MSALPPPSFLSIVNLHHLQALLQLGLVANPITGKANPPNPAMARRELQLLEILREKTDGNLTPEEATILDEIITALSSQLDAG